MHVVTQTHIQEYPLVSRGKVRDMYGLDEHTLLIVTTDRMSAFDVILKDPIPYKGVVLNQLTCYWMETFKPLIDNHLLDIDVRDFPRALQKHAAELEGRAVIVRRAAPLPIECIVRGYLSGSGWKDYTRTGQVCGYDLPSGLQESSPLPNPLFTPSTKAEAGEHDENITLDQAREKMDQDTLETAQSISLEIYQQGTAMAEERGLVIADTKFEFGLLNDSLLLIDEVLTPDSSRFWPKSQYTPGQSQPSFDKQYLRDWLSENWDKTTEPPRLPKDVIDQTQRRYLEAYALLTGQELNV